MVAATEDADIVTRLWLALLLALPAVGCSSTPDCLPTELEVAPVDVPDMTAPIAISAKLTQGGKPVAGARVSLGFAVKSSSGANAGSSEKEATDADGVVRRERPGGLVTIGLPGDRITGVEALFQPLTTADGFNDHCWSNASAPITCAGAACPPTPKP